jgi:PEP-CTERM motif
MFNQTKVILMKNLIIMVSVLLLTQQIAQAQGIIYLSNLGEASVGGSPVGSDSMNGFSFITGGDTGGYSLDSIQLAMADASGNPSGFAAGIYVMVGTPGGVGSETCIGALTGSSNPAVAGIYTYMPTNNLMLLPYSYYSILLTAETAVANGAYELSMTSTRLDYPNNGWLGDGFGDFSIAIEFPQYAITATAVPEPGTFGLFALGGLCFLWHRRSLP